MESLVDPLLKMTTITYRLVSTLTQLPTPQETVLAEKESRGKVVTEEDVDPMYWTIRQNLDISSAIRQLTLNTIGHKLSYLTAHTKREHYTYLSFRIHSHISKSG
jgi:hypothetical protein